MTQDVPRKLLLIGGIERSGTTMVTRFVNTHPAIRVAIEMGVFRQCNVWLPYHLRAFWPTLSRRLRSEWARAYIPLYARYIGALIPRAWRRIGFWDAARAMHFVFPRHRIVGDKMPLYTRSLDQYPADRSLCLVLTYRDVRAVICSGLKRRRTDPSWRDAEWAAIYERPADAARRWLDDMDLITMHADRALLIRYEDFVLEPQPYIDRLSEMLEVDPGGFESVMHRNRLHAWRTELPRTTVRQIEAVAGERLASLGYPV